MKKVLFLSLAFMFASLSIHAQSKGKVRKVKFRSNYKMQKLVSDYNRADNTATVDLRRVKNGRNLLCTDRRTGDKLYLVAKRKGRKVGVRGFMVQKRSGRWIKISSQNTAKPEPGGLGCPDGWDSKLICYTHPVYKVKVCYVRCTPTSLTMQLPPSL